MELSVILPAYLEEENLRILLPRIRDVLTGLQLDYEIIVVDTMVPMDGTPRACQDLGVTYINRTGGNFYGDAIRTGIRVSRGKHVIFMDADGSHHPEFLKELYNNRHGNDVVIASRYIEGGHTENTPMLVLMSKIVNIGYSLILNIKCKDVSNSFKLYDGNTIRSLNLRCNNFDIVEEILYKIIKGNKRTVIKELPFSFKQRMFGETKRNLFVFIFGYIVTLIRLKLM